MESSAIDDLLVGAFVDNSWDDLEISLNENLVEEESDEAETEESDEVAASSRKRKSRDEDEEDEEEDGLGVYMDITDEERNWAVALKEAVMQGEETKGIPVTDMELVQYAMVENGNVEKAMERIQGMHRFRTAWQIEDTPEHGLQSIRNFMQQQPGFHLNIEQHHDHYIHVLDFAKFYPKRVRLDKDWKIFLSGVYYLLNALYPNISATRNGVVNMMEGEGMGWDNFDIDFERRLWDEAVHAYPQHVHEFAWYHTPLVGNVFYSLLKPILPKEIRDVVRLGAKIDESFDGRLDTLFLQPSPEIANERQLQTIESFLETRYQNQAHFEL